MANEVFKNDEQLKSELLFVKCKTKETLHKWVKVFFGIDLPNCIVDENSTTTPLDMVWDIYSHFINISESNPGSLLYYACRDGFKTLSQSIAEAMCILHLEANVVHLAAIKEQSLNSQAYVKAFMRKQPMAKYVVGNRADRIEVIRYHNPINNENLTQEEYEQLNGVEKSRYREIRSTIHIIVASVESCNGKHAPVLCIDEADIFPDPEAWRESKMIPCEIIDYETQKKVQPLKVITSTRKYATGYVQDEINNSAKTGTVVGHWNIIDVTEACPKPRHRPDLPKLPIYYSDDDLTFVSEERYLKMNDEEKAKYKKGEGFHGCLYSCRLFAACKGRLATHQKSKSPLLKSLSYTTQRFTENDINMAQAQLLCRKPTKFGLVYPSLDAKVHLKTAAEMYANVFGEDPPSEIYSKEDLIHDIKTKTDAGWYAGIDFGFSHNFVCVVGFVYNNVCYIVEAVSGPGFEPGQQEDVCKNRILPLNPVTFCDPEDPGGAIRMRKTGLRVRKWKKGPGSVIAGINIVKLKLRPSFGSPQLFFLSGDKNVEFIFQQMSSHTWKLDGKGEPTDVPSDKCKDESDAVRYLIMNVFSGRSGKVSVVAGDNFHESPKQEEKLNNPSSNRSHWTQVMSITGLDPNEILSENTDEEDDKKESSGKTGGFSWSF